MILPLHLTPELPSGSEGLARCSFRSFDTLMVLRTARLARSSYLILFPPAILNCWLELKRFCDCLAGEIASLSRGT